MRHCLMALTALLASPAAPAVAGVAEIPYFARRYGVSCEQCHVLPPKLNDLGERFVGNNYRMEGLTPRSTWPFAVWVSGRSDAPTLTDTVRRVLTYLNRVEVISGGRVVAPWLSYFVEWRPVSFESRDDGTLRDRSGRFEDLFVTAQAGRVEVSVGQFRQGAQVDVSRRLGIAEPLFFAASLAGAPGGSPRAAALRSFSLAGRSPAVRLGWVEAMGGGWQWRSHATVPVPGELSLPLTNQARDEASAELALEPKGLLFETFARRGVSSLGAHLFWDGPDRYLAGVVGSTGDRTRFLTAGAGLDRVAQTTRGRWTLEAEWIPVSVAGLGARAEDRGDDGAEPAFVAFANAHVPGRRHTIRLTVERRWQRGRHALLVELGVVF